MKISFPKTIAAIGLAIGLAVGASANPKIVKMDGSSELFGPGETPKVIAEGRFELESTKLDTGKPSDIFDGNYDTILRTPSINPAYFQIVTEEPITFRGLRIRMSEDSHDYTLAAASTLDDLKAKKGSYTVLTKGSIGMDGCIIFVSPKPVSYSAFRLDAKRTSGDDYVHLLEWEFLEPVKLDSLTVDYKIRCKHGGGEPAVYEPLTENSTRPEDSILSLRVMAKIGDEVFDATDTAEVKVDAKYAKPWLGGPAWHLTKPETVGVTVTAGGLTAKGKVKVEPRTLKNQEFDLDAMYVERLPKIDFDGPNGGWPYEGQPVIWRAHAKNWGDKAVTTDYRWTIDGREVSRGKVKIRGGEEVTLDLPWNWEQKRHYIMFELDPEDKIEEFIPYNNRVEFVSDALTVGIYVERSFADIYHDTQPGLGFGDVNSFHDWTQRLVKHWNKMLRMAKFYPECPNGALDQVRIDKIVVCPDQSLPYQNGDWPTNFPNLEDKTVDLIWGYPYKFDEFKEPIDVEGIRKKTAPDNVYTDPFFINFWTIHELGHARYLVDTYGFDVHATSGDPETPNILIKDDLGRDILGLYLPKKGFVHRCHYGGQMCGEYEQYGPYDIVMLNRVAGKRPKKGNANGTSDIGEYLYDIPETFKIKFTGPNGEILANDPVKVYWAGPKNEWYGKLYDNVVDREFTTDSEGCITTDITFFDKEGKIAHSWGHANTVPIVRIDHEGKTYYIFVEVSQINMLMHLSEDPVPTLTLEVPLREGEPTPIDPEYGRRKLPDWRLRTQFDLPEY
ncbi:MAG TPA: hypothetical protein PKV43_02525 [Armatimonadota bacterium]|nr:hypothetical protein [Armatimonadota bacterium]